MLKKLERLANLKKEFDRQVSKKNESIKNIQNAFNENFGPMALEIEALETEIGNEVIAKGETVKGESLQCVYIKGRKSFDSERFYSEDTDTAELFAKAWSPDIARLKVERPEIYKRFLKVGPPTYSFKFVAPTYKGVR